MLEREDRVHGQRRANDVEIGDQGFVGDVPSAGSLNLERLDLLIECRELGAKLASVCNVQTEVRDLTNEYIGPNSM